MAYSTFILILDNFSLMMVCFKELVDILFT